MTEATTEKARNLLRLSALLPVPSFVVLQPGAEIPAALLESAGQFIVRGCIAGEDMPGRTLAGQGMTIGPVASADATTAVQRLFRESDARECILQVYVDGPSGVLICTSATQAVLEYTRLPGGVTAGRGKPFVAVFPNDIPRYAALGRYLPAIFREFGACDVELLHPEYPVFVQVRPLTATVTIDEELLRAKMALQEIAGDRWVQNEFCTDLLESPGVELALIKLYCAVLPEIAQTLAGTIDDLAPTDFIKIGQQIFMRDRDITPRYRNNLQVMNTGGWISREYSSMKERMQTEQLPPDELMRAAIVFRSYYEMLLGLPAWLTRRARRKTLELRQQCRQQLLATVTPEALPSSIMLTNRLNPLIEKDSQALNWLALDYVAAAGVVIVPGDFAHGPWRRYTPGSPSPAAPAFLITDELYPEIYPLFPHIKGIICNGGSINSHLALLAREYGMPLWIQVPDVGRFLREG